MKSPTIARKVYIPFAKEWDMYNMYTYVCIIYTKFADILVNLGRKSRTCI